MNILFLESLDSIWFTLPAMNIACEFVGSEDEFPFGFRPHAGAMLVSGSISIL